jgi:S1-C subfamily serine protease
VRINVQDPSGNGIAMGSGVVVERATVITNCHVAKAGPRLKVKHQGSVLDATLVLADEEHDLCRLSVVGLDAPAVEQGRLKQVKVGQKVYALGAPQGLDLTLSDGMVSSLRDVDEGSVIQTSAPVSPGSSGGGLFNEHGQLIGIVTFQMRSGQNLNFAVPVDWIATMSATRVADGDRAGEPADSRSAHPTSGQALNPDILGTWHCFGPLTGWSMDVTLDAQGHVNGQFNNKPLSGAYQLNNKVLNLMGDRFLVEELSASRMVLSLGQGARLACSH